MKVIIEEMDDLFHLYNEAGQAEESDFETEEEAEEYAIENGYEIVNSFYL